ncbi:MAG: AmmeMemoRadiSam system protein B [Desulfobacterales bacterium]
MKTRKADFAGSWYPATASACKKEIQKFLEQKMPLPSLGRNPVGGIVPHAGWFFSGSIACNVIHALVGGPPPEIIVILGMHLHPGSPCYIMKEGAWETPFGDLLIDETLAGQLTEKFSFIIETPDSYNPDNTIELQLPFIKYFFKDSKIIPLGVPPNKKSLEIGAFIAKSANRLGVRLKVIGSTDLTHYGSNYGFTPKGTGQNALEWVRNENDRSAIDAMLNMEPEKILQEALTNQNACCAGAVATAIAAGKHLGAKNAQIIAYSTSYDKVPGDSFVGYVGILF